MEDFDSECIFSDLQFVFKGGVGYSEASFTVPDTINQIIVMREKASARYLDVKRLLTLFRVTDRCTKCSLA